MDKAAGWKPLTNEGYQEAKKAKSGFQNVCCVPPEYEKGVLKTP
jgi:hypothetical protein